MTEYINTYNELCEKVKRWSAAYYEQDAPVVTDVWLFIVAPFVGAAVSALVWNYFGDKNEKK